MGVRSSQLDPAYPFLCLRKEFAVWTSPAVGRGRKRSAARRYDRACSERFYFEPIRSQGSRQPKILVIDGEQYLFADQDAVSVGDRVEAIVLPESKVLLACYPEGGFPEAPDVGFSLAYAVMKRLAPWAAILFVCMIVLFVHGFSVIGRDSRAKGRQGKRAFHSLVCTVELGAALGLLLVLLSSDLWRGGAFSLEYGSKPNEITGTVEGVAPQLLIRTVTFEGRSYTTQKAKVDGTWYYVVAEDSIAVGDSVKLRAFSKSGISLEIEKLSESPERSNEMDGALLINGGGDSPQTHPIRLLNP